MFWLMYRLLIIFVDDFVWIARGWFIDNSLMSSYGMSYILTFFISISNFIIFFVIQYKMIDC